MATELVIPSGFNGPHTSGNGGYSAGTLAVFVDGPATIRLHFPPPLDRSLTVERRGDVVVALDGDQVVMSGESAAGGFGDAPFVSFDSAASSESGFPGFTWHGADRCFVCGPARDDDLALRIFPGPAGESVVAAPWVPSAVHAGADGVVAPEVVWGALDCPGAWAATAFDPVGMPYFPTLGTVTGSLDEPVFAGERLVVVGRYRSTERRKLHTDVLLFGEDGSIKARTRHIEIKLFDWVPPGE